jgi:hypothetical protein
MSCGFLRGGLSQEVPQMPAVPALDRVRQRGPHGLAVGAGPVSAGDLDAWMPADPVLDDVSGAPLEDVDAPAGLGVDEDGRVDQAAAQREVVDLLRCRSKSTYPDPGIIPIADLPGRFGAGEGGFGWWPVLGRAG